MQSFALISYYSWVKKNNLRFPRCHGNLVCCNGRMYLCGGATRSYNNKDSVITSTGGIDVYNSRDDVWEHCTDMVVPRHDAAAAVVGMYFYNIIPTLTGLQFIEKSTSYLL